MKYSSEVVIAKYGVFVANFITWACGLTAFCIGIWIRIERNWSMMLKRIDEAEIDFTSDALYIGAYILIAIGVASLFIAIIGCLATILENPMLLLWYFLTILLLMVTYLGCSVWSFYKLDYILGDVSDAMRSLMNNFQMSNNKKALRALNEIQKQMKCCGNLGPNDYYLKIPPSCLDYKLGCSNALTQWFRRMMALTGSVGICFGLIHVVGLICSMYLFMRIKKQIDDLQFPEPEY
ncbi:hypothetical protein SNEBB_010869 [Seison nebaliae]|nr:hypothetical protein SNEBB_010869 [Seison nebaliae]